MCDYLKQLILQTCVCGPMQPWCRPVSHQLPTCTSSTPTRLHVSNPRDCNFTLRSSQPRGRPPHHRLPVCGPCRLMAALHRGTPERAKQRRRRRRRRRASQPERLARLHLHQSAMPTAAPAAAAGARSAAGAPAAAALGKQWGFQWGGPRAT